MTAGTKFSGCSNRLARRLLSPLAQVSILLSGRRVMSTMPAHATDDVMDQCGLDRNEGDHRNGDTQLRIGLRQSEREPGDETGHRRDHGH